MSTNLPTKIGYMPREAEEEIKKYLPLPQIIALIGPRRSGKTTLLLHFKKQLKNAVYLSFDDKEALDLFEQDIKAFTQLYLEKKTHFLFLDEFHYAKNGGKQLKYLFDFYPEKKIIISGSSSLELTIRALKYLVGRVLVVTLYPFSFAEFLLAKDKKLFNFWQKTSPDQLTSSPVFEKINHLFKEYLVYGGYPEIVLTEDPEIKKQLLKNIVNILFLHEVKDFLSLADDYKLRQLIKALSLQIGNLVNFQELAQTAQLDYRTLKRYLNFLEKIFIIRLIPPFFTNKRRELVKTPKIYFYDSGLRNGVLNNFANLEQRPDKGSLLENGVFTILHSLAEVKFWRTKAKAEVDFILESEGKTLPLEIKTTVFSPRVPLSLRSFVKIYRPKKAGVITLSPYWSKAKTNTTTCFFLPAPLLPFITKTFL